jgi:hypothetical protein
MHLQAHSTPDKSKSKGRGNKMEKGDKVYVLKTFKGEIINKLFESADKAMEYAKENGYLPCILITGTVQGVR